MAEDERTRSRYLNMFSKKNYQKNITYSEKPIV